MIRAAWRDSALKAWSVAFLCVATCPVLVADEFSQILRYDARMFSYGTLVVDARMGDIGVEGWDEPRLEVEAEKVVRTKSEEKAKPLYDRLQIKIEGADRRIVLRTLYPSRRPWRPFRDESRLSVNLRIHMPFDANLVLKSVDGDVRVRGIVGRQELRVNYGDVEVDVPSIYHLRSVQARSWLGYVESDLHGESGAGWGQKLSFSNSRGVQDIVVKVRMGGIYIYGNQE